MVRGTLVPICVACILVLRWPLDKEEEEREWRVIQAGRGGASTLSLSLPRPSSIPLRPAAALYFPPPIFAHTRGNFRRRETLHRIRKEEKQQNRAQLAFPFHFLRDHPTDSNLE